MKNPAKEVRPVEWNALVGPLIMMATDLFLLVMIVPKFKRVYYDLGTSLTGSVLFVVHDTYILLALALGCSAIAIGVTIISTPRFARVFCICLMIFGLLEAAWILTVLIVPLIGEIQRIQPK